MTQRRCKNIYFLACLVVIFGLGTIRSSPVFGKLDFLLLPGRPWQDSWHSMIEEVVVQGEKPIVSDIITSTVFRAVFAQKAVAFRFTRRYSRIDIASLETENAQQRRAIGPLLLLLGNEQGVHQDSGGHPITQLLIGAAAAEKKAANVGERNPYRCLINLRSFPSSWVSEETGHWSWKWSEPSMIYEFKGMRGKDMEQLLRDNPPENCTVYF